MEDSAKVCKFSGRVISHREIKTNSDNGSRISYAPVYEYYDYSGETKTYTSNCSSSKKKPIGTESVLYMEKETGKIFEKSELKFKQTIAIIFGSIGLFILLIAGIVIYISLN